MPVPQPQPPSAPPAKKKSKTPVIIAVVVGILVLLVGGGFGINAWMKSHQYNTAVDTYKIAESIFNQANSISAYENAQELYLAAKDFFIDLGDYQDASDYANRCNNKIVLCQKNIDYIKAVALFDAEDYAGALAGFMTLTGFKDSDAMAEASQNHLDYQAAIDLYDSGDYEAALESFKALRDIDFLDSGDWYNKTRYAQADKLVQAGDRYGAYKVFTALGSYSDAADRARACTSPYPGSGELYHNDGFYSTGVQLHFTGNGLSQPAFLKVYSGDTLVSTVFVNPDTTVRINLPSGTYTIKEADGTNWFGDQVMFGDEGVYYTLLFDGSTSKYLEYNYIYTLMLYVPGGGNVGSSGTDRSNF